MGYALSPMKRAQYNAKKRARLKEARDAWFAIHDSCVECGSTSHLEVDHIDPSTKLLSGSSLWSASKEKREAELAKCQVLCSSCHKKKSATEMWWRTNAGLPTIKELRKQNESA